MLLVFLTSRQALSSHQRQQMVQLYWLQGRDSMPNWYTINHPTTLQTHNETQWPTAACRWHFALQDVSRRQSCNLSTPSYPQVPPVWPYCRQAQCGVKYSRPPDLKSSSNVSLPFAWITGPATDPAAYLLSHRSQLAKRFQVSTSFECHE